MNRSRSFTWVTIGAGGILILSSIALWVAGFQAFLTALIDFLLGAAFLSVGLLSLSKQAH